MTAALDFAGVDFCFALGEVYGLRAWKLDEYGRLRARNWDKAGPWRPGINTAVCHNDGATGTLAMVVDPSGQGRKAVELTTDSSAAAISRYVSAGFNAYSFPTFAGPTYRVRWEDGAEETLERVRYQKPPHEAVPVEDCTCGFYAYSDPKHEEAAGNRGSQLVVGVIRGSGRTLIGTKGFRCEKAEIVGLLDPMRGGRKKADWRELQASKLRHVYPDVPLLPSRSDLLDFAPIEPTLPDPTSDDFWTLP